MNDLLNFFFLGIHIFVVEWVYGKLVVERSLVRICLCQLFFWLPPTGSKLVSDIFFHTFKMFLLSQFSTLPAASNDLKMDVCALLFQ